MWRAMNTAILLLHANVTVNSTVYACLDEDCCYFTESPIGTCQIDVRSRNGHMDRVWHSLLSVWPMTSAVVSSWRHKPRVNERLTVWGYGPWWQGNHTRRSVRLGAQPRRQRVRNACVQFIFFSFSQWPQSRKVLLMLGWFCPLQLTESRSSLTPQLTESRSSLTNTPRDLCSWWF